jgi:hypothetical protein
MLLILFVLTVCFTGRAYAQQIGSVPLRLGEGRDTVMSKLSQKYHVTDAGVVTSKAGPPYEIMGVVNFTGDRLTFVNRMWPIDATDDQSLMRGVIRAMKRLEGEDLCLVTSKRLNEPEVDSEAITVSCGRHAIHISAGTYRGRPMQVTISEHWETTKWD